MFVFLIYLYIQLSISQFCNYLKILIFQSKVSGVISVVREIRSSNLNKSKKIVKITFFNLIRYIEISVLEI